MKSKLTFIGLSLFMISCGPNDFVSTKNPTSYEEALHAQTGMQVNIKNNLPVVEGANGVPSVIHLNAQMCSWIDLDHEKSNYENQKSQPSALSECFDFNGTIHGGESETFLVPAEKLNLIYQAGKGKIKFRFKSSVQTSNFYQGCLGSSEIAAHFNEKKLVFDVIVNSQNTSWGYQCSVSGQ